MPCAQCGGVIEIVDAKPRNAPFRDFYQCQICEAKGYIRGDSNKDSSTWKREGKVFNYDCTEETELWDRVKDRQDENKTEQ